MEPVTPEPDADQVIPPGMIWQESPKLKRTSELAFSVAPDINAIGLPCLSATVKVKAPAVELLKNIWFTKVVTELKVVGDDGTACKIPDNSRVGKDRGID